MMQHVSDHFSYSQDVAWLQDKGYPLLKGVTQFWASRLQEDSYWNDGTLVVNPCNSPEHGPTTFACTHYQQLLHQVFASTIAFAPLVAESDTEFLQNLTDTLSRLDKGFHTTSWGGVAEWKLPREGEEMYDSENNTHRHLSHLWGWYPGLTLSSSSTSYLGGFINETIQNAVATSLYSRGNGNGADANAGWAKVWRAACWARLNNTEMAYGELRYAIEQNFVGNALSMYSGKAPPFQIDANFGLAGAVLSMLIVDIDELAVGNERSIVLGPAIPRAWGRGNVKGLRLRGGGIVDFGWDEKGIVRSVVKGVEGVRFFNRLGTMIDSE
jgi:alpha-L-fucosidase 2